MREIDEERWIAQGRARDAAKAFREEIDTLELVLSDYRRRLQFAGRRLWGFIQDPVVGQYFDVPQFAALSRDLPKLSEADEFLRRSREFTEAVLHLKAVEARNVGSPP